MRNVQTNNNLAISGYQVWDVTDVAHPVKASELTGIRSTHKQWWECDTGITYMGQYIEQNVQAFLAIQKKLQDQAKQVYGDKMMLTPDLWKQFMTRPRRA